MTDITGKPTRYAMIGIEVRVPVDLRHDRDVATDIEVAAQEYANETYGRDYDGAEPEPAEPMPQAQTEGIEHILAAVRGDVFRSETQNDAIVMLRDDPYAISVDKDGNTSSAYLVTVPPAEIAAAMDADEAEIAGWTTGYDI